ncbi:SusD/RagB family nutrient-binding outer membrane lipoprotein [Arcticibacterium luteifluviistationis]|uniref:SusD/RagB family nutrient-binding outer membrane lipoprotein n=1 Tax=Arcticibacterium luteifluviistationis TaxID=1784714 RepID=A0A2Z4GGE5_9BACT|nr:SusD/RagB family nutrient-binding outer membrane lipoprotein [Arcticibacterium luteifluviistationis]AWW00341.1 SusD/RagB family nutrient-binding outer membrane lipoprotein [Arcticibacterium luteifluviistationis]
MKFIQLSILFLSFFMLTGCEKDFSELEKDPNRPLNVPAALVLKEVQYQMYNATGRPFSAEMRWNQFYCSNYNYYATNEYTWTEMPNHFYTLKNVTKMEEEALNAGAAAVNPYSAVAKFSKAFFYDQMTKRVGDLPLTGALQGGENFEPMYDSQKEIYKQILTWLDEANTEMATLIAQGEGELTGDIYFDGDLRQWQKVVNAFQLRVLTTLSKKEADTDLNIKARFAEIISNPSKYPLLNGMDDNLQFISNQFNKYPSNPDNFGFDATRQNMSAAYVERLKERNDPRLFVTTEPAGSEIASGKQPNDFSAYLGASSGEDLADMSFKAGISNEGFAPGSYSFQNRNRYYADYEGEPTFIVGYPEMCFNIAEGIHRGWGNTGSADAWYKNGVEASFQFYGISSGTNTFTYSQTGGRNASDLGNFEYDFELQDYLAQPNVKYTADANGLEQIITQKYLSFFMNSGMEGYFNWRRTGFPEFYTGVGTGNSGRIAVRWQYPYSERTTNTSNYKTAIDSQFSGKDDINEEIWLNK